MIVLVKVYLNEGPDHYFGFTNDFSNEPRLRMAAAFNVSVLEADTMPGTSWPTPLLEQVFEELNIGGDGAPAWVTQYRAESNRSLSVGDVVTLTVADQTKAYACESVGWKEVTVDAVAKAVGDFVLAGAN